MGCAMQSRPSGNPSTLRYPLPKGMRVVARTGQGTETVFIVQMALPGPVLDLLSEALDLASRITGSLRFGALLTAVSQEFVGTWSAPASDVASPREGSHAGH